MNHDQFNGLVIDELNRLLELNKTKGVEYAGHEDALGFFKRRAAKLSITPQQVWAVLAGKHWEAIESFCENGAVRSEPIDGRIRDMIMYSLLLLGLERDADHAEALAAIDAGDTE